MPPADQPPAVAIADAHSPDWSRRAHAGQQLALWADRQDVIPVLLRLLIHPGDTAVIDWTCDALLARNDLRGVRLIAQAVAQAPDPEYLDHMT